MASGLKWEIDEWISYSSRILYIHLRPNTLEVGMDASLFQLQVKYAPS